MGNWCSSGESTLKSQIGVSHHAKFHGLNEIKQQNFSELKSRCLKQSTYFEDPLFPASSRSITYSNGTPTLPINWLRPWEICRLASAQNGVRQVPRFYISGPSRFDLIQGDLGDCWLLAAAASLAERNELIARLIPEHGRFLGGGGFGGHGQLHDDYCGIFRFRFFHFGEWIEVNVDDRLPCRDGRPLMVHSEASNEFWGALLEKAYAKFYGSYEALKGGLCADALTDLTGGVVENVQIKSANNVSKFDVVQLAQCLDGALKRGALVTTGIWDATGKNRILGNGLVTGHAYTISQIEKMKLLDGHFFHLLRVRNPWGGVVEWNGRWSDHSVTWRYVADEVRVELNERLKRDGDFWMDLSDFVQIFNDVDICHLPPDGEHPFDYGIRDEVDRSTWKVTVVHGAWKGPTAGGRLKLGESFARNPQFVLTLADGGDGDPNASCVVELTQKEKRVAGKLRFNIGFYIFPLESRAEVPLPYSYFCRNVGVASLCRHRNLRAVVKRITLQPGRYVIVPTTLRRGSEAEFMLRIWSEVNLDAALGIRFRHSNLFEAAGERSDSILSYYKDVPLEHMVYYAEPNETRNGTVSSAFDNTIAEEAEKYFSATSGEEMALNAYELQWGINRLCSDVLGPPVFTLDIHCCKAVVSLYDVRSTHKFHWENFDAFLKLLKTWLALFKKVDVSCQGFLKGHQMIEALNSFGGYKDLFELERQEVLQARLLFVFGNSEQRFSFSAFVHAFCKLELVRRTYLGDLILESQENGDKLTVDKREMKFQFLDFVLSP